MAIRSSIPHQTPLQTLNCTLTRLSRLNVFGESSLPTRWREMEGGCFWITSPSIFLAGLMNKWTGAVIGRECVEREGEEHAAPLSLWRQKWWRWVKHWWGRYSSVGRTCLIESVCVHRREDFIIRCFKCDTLWLCRLLSKQRQWRAGTGDKGNANVQ